MRIAFFGTPEFAVPTLQALIGSAHTVVAAVSQPDRPKGRGQKLQPTPVKIAAGDRVQVLQPERIRDEAFLRAIEEMALDLGVVAAYGKILPDRLLALPRFGMINVHASLLPEYRGAAPVHRAVIDGRTETGVTIMRVVTALDAGAMLSKLVVPIGPDDTSDEVERVLASRGAGLLLEAVDSIAAGTIVEVPQDEGRATYAPKILKSEGAIDWREPAARIHNLVRGLRPWPLVSGWIDGRRYLIHRTRRTGARSTAPAATILEASTTVGVACSDGEILDILEIQPEGKRVMTAKELLAGRAVKAGATIGRA